MLFAHAKTCVQHCKKTDLRGVLRGTSAAFNDMHRNRVDQRCGLRCARAKMSRSECLRCFLCGPGCNPRTRDRRCGSSNASYLNGGDARLRAYENLLLGVCNGVGACARPDSGTWRVLTERVLLRPSANFAGGSCSNSAFATNTTATPNKTASLRRPLGPLKRREIHGTPRRNQASMLCMHCR